MKISSNVLKTLCAGAVLASLSVAAHAGTDTIFTGGGIVSPGGSGGSGLGGNIDGPVSNVAPVNPPEAPEPSMIVTGASMLGMTGIGLIRGRRRSIKSAK